MLLRSKLIALSLLLMLAPLAVDTAPSAAADDDDTVAALDLDALRGKVVVVEVMETWCGACRSAIPTLNRWHERDGDRGLYVVAASPESADSLRRYRARYGLHAHAAVDADAAFQRRFAVDAYPTFIVLDKTGEPRGRFRGAGGNIAAIEAMITELLGRESALGGTGIE